MLDWYEAGRSKLYLASQVNDLAHWLFVRKGLIALDKIPFQTHLLPPMLPRPGKASDEGEDEIEARWRYLEWWSSEDMFGTECSECGASAVMTEEEDGLYDGRIWCPECGVFDLKEK